MSLNTCFVCQADSFKFLQKIWFFNPSQWVPKIWDHSFVKQTWKINHQSYSHEVQDLVVKLEAKVYGSCTPLLAFLQVTGTLSLTQRKKDLTNKRIHSKESPFSILISYFKTPLMGMFPITKCPSQNLTSRSTMQSVPAPALSLFSALATSSPNLIAAPDFRP